MDASYMLRAFDQCPARSGMDAFHNGKTEIKQKDYNVEVLERRETSLVAGYGRLC